MEILGGLNNIAVTRLKKTWAVREYIYFFIFFVNYSFLLIYIVFT